MVKAQWGGARCSGENTWSQRKGSPVLWQRTNWCHVRVGGKQTGLALLWVRAVRDATLDQVRVFKGWSHALSVVDLLQINRGVPCALWLGHVYPRGWVIGPSMGHVESEFGPENSKDGRALCRQWKTHGFSVSNMAPDQKNWCCSRWVSRCQ